MDLVVGGIEIGCVWVWICLGREGGGGRGGRKNGRGKKGVDDVGKMDWFAWWVDELRLGGDIGWTQGNR